MQHRYATLPQTPDFVLSDPLGFNSPIADGADAAASRDSPESESDDFDEKDDTSTAAAADARTELAKRELRSLLARQQRRHVVQILLLVGAGVVALSFAFAPSTRARPNASQPAASAADTLQLPSMLVGPRPRFAPDGRSMYSGCSYDGLLRAVQGATVRPDGLSRHPNYTHVDYITLDPFEWSFDLPGLGTADAGGGQTVEITEECPPMPVWAQAQACELLSAFGGLYSTGDSYTRHLYTALMMILRNRNDGAVRNYATTDDCRHEHAFDDAKLCRDRIDVDTNWEEHVCGNAAQVGYVEMFWPAKLTYDIYRDWHSRQPKRNQVYSPVFITGIGLHFSFNMSVPHLAEWIERDHDFMNRQHPLPAKLFLGPHKPGVNQLERWIPTQGPPRLAAYKEAMAAKLANYSASPLAIEGSWRYLDTWRLSEGAVSYDGSHFSYQVNLEKAYTVLTLLDVLWSEIVAAGGLAELRATQM